MKRFSIGALLLIAVSIVGCNAEGDSVNDVSQDQSRERMQKQMSADNPNMPPQARAAAQRMQGMGSDYSKQYGSNQPKKGN